MGGVVGDTVGVALGHEAAVGNHSDGGPGEVLNRGRSFDGLEGGHHQFGVEAFALAFG